MIEIIPAILPKSFDDLHDKVGQVSHLVPIIQIDICDGVFVPSKSWPYIKKPDVDFERILREEKGFPDWEELDFEVDLMVSNPEEAVGEWLRAGARRVIVHLEAVKDPRIVFDKMKSILPTEDSFLYTEIGVAINPDTPNEALEPIIELVDFVQFMGIQKIGFQGEAFDERVLNKIYALRMAHPDVMISVDGGVNLDTAPRLIEAGVNRLVVGSAIFGSHDVAEAIDSFLAIQEGQQEEE